MPRIEHMAAALGAAWQQSKGAGPRIAASPDSSAVFGTLVGFVFVLIPTPYSLGALPRSWDPSTK
jgi:hypothetical protein